MAKKQGGPISFNVGGAVYATSLTTLQRCPESMLTKLLNQENIPSQRDGNGNIFIDRDGTMFRYILNYLRNGEFELPFTEFGQLLRELDFYQLGDQAQKMVTDKICGRANYPEAEHVTVFTDSVVATSMPNSLFVQGLQQMNVRCGLVIYHYDPTDRNLIYAALRLAGFRKESTSPEIFIKEKAK